MSGPANLTMREVMLSHHPEFLIATSAGVGVRAVQQSDFSYRLQTEPCGIFWDGSQFVVVTPPRGLEVAL